MSNHLTDESSPYLLQHADNPVDWYPWCEEAFEQAREEDKPVFLSIGYSTCHWCHVMAKESFENPEIAAILNKHFICIKVDREERPDIDSVYMEVCQSFTGRGGWPLSVFMTADKKPFFAGTYFPVQARPGMRGFQEILLKIAQRWKTNRITLSGAAEKVYLELNLNREDRAESAGIDRTLPGQAFQILERSFDERYGGFGSAPKFPLGHNLWFLALYSQVYQDGMAMDMVCRTVEAMRRGGIFDQLGYGFSRYSTDNSYLIPHFEKMLYDNALMILACTAAYQASGDKLFLDTAKKTAKYILRDLKSGEGGFYSAQDADSEGEEGKYYLWEYQEICSVLGEEKGKAFCAYFDVTAQGNFEGKNILNLLKGNDIFHEMQEEAESLRRYRGARGSLALDDKILTSWNALAVWAFAMLYRCSGEKEYLAAAKKANCFLEEKMMEDDSLYVSYRKKRGKTKGFLEDYAYFAAAQLALYEVTGNEEYLECAEEICGEAERQFADPDGDGYFLYGTENEELIARPKETYDGALPSGNSVMAYCLVRLSQITDREKYHQKAGAQLAFLSEKAAIYPAGHSMFLIALILSCHPGLKVTVVLAEGDSADRVITRIPLNAQVRMLGEETAEYPILNGKTTYYVCGENTCLPPTNQFPDKSRDYLFS